MQGIFRKENTDKALKYGIYRHLPTYEKIIRNLVSFYSNKAKKIYFNELINIIKKDNLLFTEAAEIRKYLLKKYNQVYFIDDIENCLLKIKNNKAR